MKLNLLSFINLSFVNLMIRPATQHRRQEGHAFLFARLCHEDLGSLGWGFAERCWAQGCLLLSGPPLTLGKMETPVRLPGAGSL